MTNCFEEGRRFRETIGHFDRVLVGGETQQFTGHRLLFGYKFSGMFDDFEQDQPLNLHLTKLDGQRLEPPFGRLLSTRSLCWRALLIGIARLVWRLLRLRALHTVLWRWTPLAWTGPLHGLAHLGWRAALSLHRSTWSLLRWAGRCGAFGRRAESCAETRWLGLCHGLPNVLLMSERESHS